MVKVDHSFSSSVNSIIIVRSGQHYRELSLAMRYNCPVLPEKQIRRLCTVAVAANQIFNLTSSSYRVKLVICVLRGGRLFKVASIIHLS